MKESRQTYLTYIANAIAARVVHDLKLGLLNSGLEEPGILGKACGYDAEVGSYGLKIKPDHVWKKGRDMPSSVVVIKANSGMEKRYIFRGERSGKEFITREHFRNGLKVNEID